MKLPVLIAATTGLLTPMAHASCQYVGPTNGTLVIVGGGSLSDSIYQRVLDLAGGYDAPVVVVPTAGGEPTYGDDEVHAVAFRRVGATNVTVLHTYDPAEADTEEFARPLVDAKAVWFSGGRQWRLVDAYAGTATEQAFWDVLGRNGVIGGTSAGATIQGSFLARGDTRNNQVMIGDHTEGFGFVKNIAIDQHVLVRNRQFDMFDILREYPELLGVSVDENTALIVSRNDAEVFGASYVIVYDGGFWSREGSGMKNLPPPESLFYFLRDGDRYDLAQRQGAGKTTLLQHILRSNHGLRIAIIVNDIGAINVDASLIKKTHRISKTNEKVIALQNGCICCTLRGDLLEELVRLSKLAQFDYIIIESSGISEPEQVAETFDERLAEKMELLSAENQEGLDADMVKVLEQVKQAGGLGKFAYLDTTVTVIDAFTMFNDFNTGDLMSARRNDIEKEDERTVSDLMVDQIEFADVIIVNKVDMVSAETKGRILNLIKTMNHRAKIIEAVHGKMDSKEIVNTKLFRMDVAQTGYGWLQDLHEMTLRQVNGKNVFTPKPETEEYNVSSMIYSRRRPFHPRRLWGLIYDKFILQMEMDEDEDEEMEDDEADEEMADWASDSEDHSRDASTSTAPTTPAGSSKDDEMDVDMQTPENAVILANKRAHPVFNRLFRSKGQFFLATRPHRAGGWSQAGGILTLTGDHPWFVTLDPSEYMSGDGEVDRLLEADIKGGGEWGDRRQEIVFIGEKLDRKALEGLLDECLLNDEEFAQWEAVMRDAALDDEQKRDALEELWDDGFPEWAGDEDHEGHDHGRPGELRSIREHIGVEVS
ncbi:hypothetical protein S40293_00607 [Stachybotrys chartarum IBT 40293]|nr:hypothetical protein S40293_00607 [Stachybotrys chartarum IBT 40293]